MTTQPQIPNQEAVDAQQLGFQHPDALGLLALDTVRPGQLEYGGAGSGNNQAEYVDDALTKDQKLAQAAEWLNSRIRLGSDENSPIPEEVASEVAVLAQKQMNQIDDGDGVIDDEYYTVTAIRDSAISVAEELDFELVLLGNRDWPLLVGLNAMHDKFTSVSNQDLAKFLGDEASGYEYKALRIRNIIADHAPALLTEDIKAVLDPSQSLWRASSAQASILLRSGWGMDEAKLIVKKVPTSLPIRDRVTYETEDDEALTDFRSMNEAELELYCRPGSISDIKERGYALFGELNMPARETLLARRLFETVAKSRTQERKKQADERNRALEGQSVLQEGDLVHATQSVDTFDVILGSGLQCGESVIGNNRSVIQHPYTVSFLEVDRNIAEATSMAESLDRLKNKPYGAINMVFHRDPDATEYVGQRLSGPDNQRQIFGGIPATEITSIIIRNDQNTSDTAERVIKAIVKHRVFIPIYSGSTGEPLLTSRQFDQLLLQDQQH